MKIYVVYDIFSKEVFGVFKTHECAQNYIDTEPSMTPGERDSCEIQEWEMGD